MDAKKDLEKKRKEYEEAVKVLNAVEARKNEAIQQVFELQGVIRYLEEELAQSSK